MPPGDERPRPLLRRGETLARKAQKQSGGGEKYRPRTFDEARALLAPMTAALRTRALEIPESMRGERIVFEAELLPNYLAASYFPKELRAAADLVLVGTKAATGTLRTKSGEKPDQPTKSLLLAGTVESVARLDNLINEPPATTTKRVKEDIATIERIEIPGPDRVLRRRKEELAIATERLPAWEAVMHPPLDRRGQITAEARQLVLDRWSSYLADLGGYLHGGYVRAVGNLLFMPVSLPPERLEEAAGFNALRVLRPMPRMRDIGGAELRQLPASEAAPTPPSAAPSDAEVIAIFDGGVDESHPLLAPFVKQVDLTSSAPEPTPFAHGNLVTSSALFGHLTSGASLTPPPAKVDHYRVLPRPDDVDADDEVYWVIDQIEAILSGGPYRIAVLSYGPNEPVEEDLEPHRFTSALDRLAYLDDIAFAVAAGNNARAEISPLGLDRVQPPADGANVIGVGACAEPGDVDPVRAHYSAVGPGRAGMRIQPLGVCFGGEGQRFVGAAPGGGLQASLGTSFAAPTVARGLATLRAPLGPESFKADTLRAFAAHFATGCEGADRNLIELGHGRLPSDYRAHLECDPNELTVLVEDTLKRGQTKGYPFPVPPAGLTGGVSLRWTVSYISPIDEEEAVEYTLAGLDVDMRPHRTRHWLNPPKGLGLSRERVDTRTDKTRIAAREGEGWKLAKNPITRSGAAHRSEQTQVEEGKWETVVRHESGFQAASVHLPEVWLTYLERGQGELIDAEDSIDLDFAMLLTIRAPKVVDLYETVTSSARYDTLVPISLPVPVQVDIPGV
jgi:Subtilase family